MRARRCVSQMVLARVSNVKSGWKSMFMVFTTAANDESPMIVRLAFDTVEKIVREHFDYITETEVPPARCSTLLHYSPPYERRRRAMDDSFCCADHKESGCGHNLTQSGSRIMETL